MTGPSHRRDDAEAVRFGERHLDRGDGRRRRRDRGGIEHLRVVHLVDVVARQHDQVIRVLAFDRVEVLIDGVGRSEIPVFADALLRRQDLDELAELLRDTPQPIRMWRLSDSDLYCVAMKIRRRPELMQLLSVKSMIR